MPLPLFAIRLALFGQAPDAPPAPLIDDPSVVAAFDTLWNGVVHGQLGPVLAFAAVIVLTWAVRTFGERIPGIGPKLAPWLQHPIVAWALPLIGSTAFAGMTALLAGKPIGVALKTAFGVAAAAVWAYVGGKKVLEARALAAAKAESALLDKNAALRVLDRGPNP